MTKLKLVSNTNEKIIMKAIVFIIPEAMQKLENLFPDKIEEYTKQWNVSKSETFAKFSACDDVNKIDDLMNDNYSETSLNIPELKAFNKKVIGGYRCLIPESMPAEPFKDLDDGDKIYLEFNDEENNITGAIEFTLNQKCKKYNLWGSFKNVFDPLYKNSKNN